MYFCINVLWNLNRFFIERIVIRHFLLCQLLSQIEQDVRQCFAFIADCAVSHIDYHQQFGVWPPRPKINPRPRENAPAVACNWIGCRSLWSMAQLPASQKQPLALIFRSKPIPRCLTHRFFGINEICINLCLTSRERHAESVHSSFCDWNFPQEQPPDIALAERSVHLPIAISRGQMVE